MRGPLKVKVDSTRSRTLHKGREGWGTSGRLGLGCLIFWEFLVVDVGDNSFVWAEFLQCRPKCMIANFSRGKVQWGWSMAASVWTGYLTFGLISMPVRLFSGARGSRVSFHILHRDDLTRVRQQL